MSSESARYVAIADWYVEFTKDWDSEPFAPLQTMCAGSGVIGWPGTAAAQPWR